MTKIKLENIYVITTGKWKIVLFEGIAELYVDGLVVDYRYCSLALNRLYTCIGFMFYWL